MTKIPQKFSDFLKEGTVAGVGPGSSRAEVIQRLGPPTLWDRGDGTIEEAYKFQYPGVQVMFEDNRVDALTIWATEEWENSPIVWTDPFIGAGRFVEEVEDYLVQHPIGYRVLVSRGQRGYQFVTEGNVGIAAFFHVTANPLEGGGFDFDQADELTVHAFVSRGPGRDWSY